MIDILGKLFGSPARVKIMRLFLLNPTLGFEISDIVSRSKVDKTVLCKELKLLETIGFVQQRIVVKTSEKIVSKKKTILKKKVTQWFLNQRFPYIHDTNRLLVGSEFLKKEDLAERFRSVGKIKLLLVSGIFIQHEDSRIDILVVGDNLKRSSIEQVIRGIEAEIGKELVYAIFETSDFTYRLNMYDKLIRDVFDFPHEKIIDIGKLSEIVRKN